MIIKIHINRRANTIPPENNILIILSNRIINTWDDNLKNKITNNSKKNRRGRKILILSKILEVS